MIATFAVVLALSGVVPHELGIASRVVWVSAEASAPIGCEVVEATRWLCDVPQSQPGVVVIIGDGQIAYVSGAGRGVDDVPRIRRWGRMVRLMPAGTAEDLQELEITAWRPDRSEVRQHTRRFTRIEDSTVDIIRLSQAAVWISGGESDGDGFISIDGPGVGSTRVSLPALAEGPPEAPFFVSLSMPFVLTGRVQSDGLQDVAGADVELFEPLAAPEGGGPPPAPQEIRREVPRMILHASARSDSSGAFAFERLAPGSYLIVATENALGRGALEVTSLAAPAVVRLVSPVRARGRVLRQHRPVVGARVRFVPTPEAFLATADPRDLIADETATGDDGRFILPLPPQLDGAIQVIAAEGTSMRVSVAGSGASKEILMGDITLPEHRRLTVRLIDPAMCTMWAVGPLGPLGLTIVRATASGGEHWFDIPEAGEWALDAECQGVSYGVEPRSVVVPEHGPDTSVDVSIIR